MIRILDGLRSIGRACKFHDRSLLCKPFRTGIAPAGKAALSHAGDCAPGGAAARGESSTVNGAVRALHRHESYGCYSGHGCELPGVDAEPAARSGVCAAVGIPLDE